MKSNIFKLLLCFSILSMSVSLTAEATQMWTFENEREFLISSKKDEPVTFSAEIIEKNLSVSNGQMTAITLTSLPKPSDGLLLKGSEIIREFEKISRNDIALISFVPVYGSTSASFTFIPENVGAVKTTAVINLMNEPNNPPISVNKNFATIKNLPVIGNIPVRDPENDVVTIHTIENPQKGTISVDGTNFRYVPNEGKSGTDSYVYYVKDSYGNISSEHVLNFDIEKIKQPLVLSDMTDNAYHYSAIKAEQAGILSGEKVGSAKLFYPETPIKRSEFLVMLTAATGVQNDLMVCVNTGLSNDASLRMWVKPYVTLSMENGIIDSEYFSKNDTLTRAEAICMIDKAMGKENTLIEGMFIKDIGAVPNEALQSYINLESANMLHLYDGNAYPNAVLTRDYASDLLYSLYEYKNM